MQDLCQLKGACLFPMPEGIQAQNLILNVENMSPKAPAAPSATTQGYSELKPNLGGSE